MTALPPRPGPGSSPGFAGFAEAPTETLYAASKVPEVTLGFWVAKLLTTGMGETTWDWSAHALGPAPAIALGALGFVVALVVQLRTRTYRPWIYWAAVLMVSVFGTTVADAVHVVLGVPYAVSTVVFALGVLAAFGLWYRSEGTLATRAVTTRRRELFYWTAVILTFALGTAAGDLTATTLGVGYAASIAVFGVLFGVPLLCRPTRATPAVAAFWTAYVFTRPLGASVADWLGVPPGRGGLGVGTGLVSLIALVAIVGVVAVMTAGRRRAPRAV